MATTRSNKKIAAIYDLRDAAEAKARAQTAAETLASPSRRDALLDAQMLLETRTVEAVEACHDCDEPADAYARETGSGVPARRRPAHERETVVDVDFGIELGGGV